MSYLFSEASNSEAGLNGFRRLLRLGRACSQPERAQASPAGLSDSSLVPFGLGLAPVWRPVSFNRPCINRATNVD